MNGENKNAPSAAATASEGHEPLGDPMHSPVSHTQTGTQEPSGAMAIEDVARVHRKHVATVRLALSDRSLHGTQQKFTGRWLIDPRCADAWARGEKCAHVAIALESTDTAPAERWRMPSALSKTQRHEVRFGEDGWRISAVQIENDELTIAQARAFVEELQSLIAIAETADARKIRRASTVDERLRDLDDGAYFSAEGSPSWGSNS